MDIAKYPRTYHLSCSPEVHSDDKVLPIEIEETFLNEELYISEKIDGGNAPLHAGKVYARAISNETFHPSFTKLKNLYKGIYYEKMNEFDFHENILYGENVQAEHSIKYTKLNSPYYLFNILSLKTNIWKSVEEVEEISKQLNLPMVPFIAKRKFKTIKELSKFLAEELKKPSAFGEDREGFVIRKVNQFKTEDFYKNVCKYVRKGHVQTEDHWSKNWKENKILKEKN